MTHADWLSSDYNAAFNFLLESDEAGPLVEAGSVTVLLPTALPGRSPRLLGLFMAAPLAVFLVTLAAFPFVVLGGPWQWSGGGWFVALLALALSLGLLFAMKLLLKNRDLFPRCHFVTLGEAGIGMHFARWHRASAKPAAGIPWDRLSSVSERQSFFPPALLVGVLATRLIAVEANNGDTVLVPLAACDRDLAEEIRQRIRARLSN